MMTIQLRIGIVVWSVITVITALFAYFLYDTQKKEFLDGIDRQLNTGAIMARSMAGADYHDQIVDKNSISKDAYLRLGDTYNTVCRASGFQSLWSNLILDDGSIVFTSATSTSKDIAEGDHVLFFDTYSAPEAFQSAITTGKETFSTFHKQWGSGRMILVPYQDSMGRFYVFGASISVAELGSRLHDTALKAFLLFLLMLAFGTLAAYFLALAISRPIRKLSLLTERITAEEDGITLPTVGGSLELDSLASNINTMSRAILSRNHELQKREQELIRDKNDIKDLQQQIEFILGATNTGLDIIDSDFNIRYIDPEWKKKYSPINNRKCFDYFAGATEPCPGCGIVTAMKTKKIVVTEETLPKENNRPIQVTTIPYQTADGEWLCAEVNTDVSERKKLEEKLLQAHKMEAIGTLAAGIAHDFNNILGAIIGYSELAKDQIPEGSIARDDLDNVLLAGKRAKDLIAQILAFSRQSKSEHILLKPQPLVREVIRLLRSLIPTTISIQQHIDDECGMIQADPTQLQQIIMNLCTNAYQAMEEHGGTLSIALERKELTADDLKDEPSLAPGLYLQLTVGDTGSGIPPEIQEKIFDPYFTTKKTGKGTGMGLAMVHGIVKNHSGMIHYESKVGEGTVFSILFPRDSGGGPRESANKSCSPNRR